MREDIIILPVKEKKRAAKGKGRPRYSKGLFWDIWIPGLDYEQERCFVVERVFKYGAESDVRRLFAYYGFEEVRKEVTNIACMDRKLLNYLSVIFKIPQRRFRCYKKSRSQSAFLNF
jgi:hypothetical protein